MNIEEYISSGVIEACLSGIATKEEMSELEMMRQKYREVDEATLEIQATLDAYAGRHAQPPPDFLKKQIWQKLNDKQLSHQEKKGNHLNNVVSTKEVKAYEKRDKRKAVKLVRLKFYAAASIALLLISLFFNAYLWQKRRSTRQDNVRLKSLILNNKKTFAAQTANYKQKLQLALSPDFDRVTLKGVNNHKNDFGILIWDNKTREVYLSLSDLPKPPHGKQYQLWSIVDGKPVSAGVYTHPDNNNGQWLQKMKKVSRQTQMFAVTLEKEGGVKTPTMSAMYVAAKI